MEVRTEGKTDGSITISLRNFVGEGIKKLEAHLLFCFEET